MIEFVSLPSGSYGIAVSESPEYVFWVDETAGTISRVDGNQNGQTDILTGRSGPIDIYVDQINDKIYWTERSAGKISRADFDGSNIEVLFSGLTDPVGLTVSH